MTSRGQQIVGVILVGALCARGYLWQRESDSLLLASIVGDYTDSSVGYVMDPTEDTVQLMGKTGGERMIDVIFLYDPDLVRVGEINTSYHYLLEDNDGLARLRLDQLPTTWNETELVSVRWDGDLGGVVVSDISLVDDEGSFRTLPVSNDSLCIGTECGHDV